MRPLFCWRTNQTSPTKPQSIPSTCNFQDTPTEARSEFRCMPPLYLPKLAKKYVWGAYRVGPLSVYTTAGLGTIALPVRLNCPPEITFLTLARSPKG